MDHVQEFEAVISEIDKALLRLAKTSEEDYVFFDFKGHIQELLLLMPGPSEDYIKKIRFFHGVFKDLLEEVTIEWSVLEKINDEDNSILWKRYRHDRNRPNASAKDNLVYYEKDAFEEHKTIWEVGYKTATISFSKLDVLLERLNYDAGDNQIALRILESSAVDQCIRLIEGAGFNFQNNNSLTFEKYLGWIDAAGSESTLVEEIPVLNGDIKIKWNGGPAVLGYVMDELDRNGYLSLPYGANKKKNAEFLLKIFDIKTSARTLAAELSENTNSLVEANKRIEIKPLVKSRE